ncbi:MAG: PKD domain-containing protein [Saprospiraceae bacterium]|nr:PKD domain-containing protein [Saprospiraceae bacterium]
MRKLYYLLALMVVSSLALVLWEFQNEVLTSKKLSKKERIDGAIRDYLFTSSDVDLGIIPYDKLFAAIDEGQRRVNAPSRSRSMLGNIADAVWRERGPSNRGGRTRAIMIDESDPARNRIWVGGVSGGLWRTEDITQVDPQWVKLGIYFESLSISDIAQDPSDLNAIYVSTGESYTGDVQGAGIFRSTDDGATWTLLPSTTNSVLSTVNEIYVHTNGDIYAASAYGGLLRSEDDGSTWEKVIGTGLAGSSSDNIHDLYFVESNQTFYISDDFAIFKSTTGDRADWTKISLTQNGFPNNVNRVEFAICPDDPDILYAIGAVGSFSSNTFVTTNGGEQWISKAEPAIFESYGQAWYDLDINADPFNCNRLLSGGVNMAESAIQGSTWRVVATEMHVDHHNITYDPKIQGRVFFGNDGGIWMSVNGGQSAVDKSIGYVTTQFYAGAIHPTAGSPYVMGGTQDNNSLIIEEAGLSPSKTAWGGDGVFCFIDQNEPDTQIVSSQGGNYGLSINGGFSFGFGASVNGEFINRSGYDDNANILYGQVNQSGIDDIDFFRWNINTSLTEDVDISGYNINVSAVKADPAVANRIYFGGQAGLVLRVDNANTGDPKTSDVSVFANLPGNASVSCVYMDKQTSDHALISLFSFGASLENLWVTYNAGAEWTSIEGDLPDLPVRWAIFDPSDHDRAMIATDAGIWTTDDIDGDQTHWEPTNPDNGMPFVRVDMLLVRESDKVVLAATYGRGLMTTDVFSAPAAVILTQPVAYEGQSILIDGSLSVNAQNYQWNLGDNTTSTEPEITHAYDSPGTYTISLTINGNITETRTISILPYLPAPYEAGEANYAGDFETQPEHFAAYNIRGTGFQRGVSTKPGKDGTNSGTSAWVLGINDNLYQNNTRAELYTPMYDFTEPGLYEFRFYGKFAIQNRNDGFQVEYSTDGGASWTQLGTNANPNWYNYLNENLATGAFPIGKSYFTNAKLNWTQYVKDVSFLAGRPRASFRFVFRADGEDQAQGLAIDDFEITRYDGELKTTITVFNADYTAEQEVTINWATGIEYQCKQFLLERSYTGFGFTQVSDTPAKGVVSTFATEYSRTDQSLRGIIYYRLKVINENPDIGYAYTFYTDTIVVRRDVEADIVHNVLPNPFTDRIGVSFSSIIDEPVTFRLYDVSGRLVIEDIAIPNAVSYTLDQFNLPTGVYILAVQIGEGEIKAYKLLSQGN